MALKAALGRSEVADAYDRIIDEEGTMNDLPSPLARSLGWVFLLTLGAALGLAPALGPISSPVDSPISLVETSLPAYDAILPTIDEPNTTALIPTHGPGSRVGVSAPAISPGGVIYRVNTTQPALAFTFDLDMTPGMLQQLQSGRVRAWYDPEVVRLLEQQNVSATIFVTGLAARAYPQLVAGLAQSPQFEIGDHSNRHYAFTPGCYGLRSIGNSEDQSEVQAAQANIREVAGVVPRYFRFPGGCFDAGDLMLVSQLGMQVVQWDVVSGDAFNHNTNAIVRTVIARARPGSIVIFHLGGPNAPRTADALKVLIPYFQSRGYTFVTVSQLLQALP
jgi:peptidoglycan/xylan/chitin deacetylase (PgdA/CDA1 family)